METKVFKIPDGEGGWTFKVQGPDGTWVETDEKGSPIQDDRDGLSGRSDVPKGRASRRTGKKEISLPVHVNLKMPAAEYRALSRYVHWRSLNEDIHLTVTEVVVTAVRTLLKKDRQFVDYLRSRDGGPGEDHFQ